jgi:tRNA A37 threonylcarbamoyladenosine synthetase subunit TsaC/SUA5/YrdC
MKILLAQTDTTVGFLSKDAQKLREAKGRDESKPFLKVFSSLQAMGMQLRVPNAHKRRVRYSRKTTFIVKNQAFRYVTDTEHSRLIDRHGWFYSTSANESGSSFDPAFCHERADWIVEDSRGLSECSSSAIYRLGRNRLKRLR